MRNQAPCMARSSRSNTAIKMMLVAVFLTLLLAGYFTQQPTRAAMLPQAKEEKNPMPATEKNLALGLDHYDGHCANCHGAGGQGDTKLGRSLRAPDLRSEKTQSKSDAEWFRIISEGVKEKGMPGFAKTHQPTEIWQMTLFLRRLPTLTEEERKKLELVVPPGARHRKGGHKHDQEHDHDEQEGAEKKDDPAAAQPSADRGEHKHTEVAKKEPPAADRQPQPHAPSMESQQKPMKPETGNPVPTGSALTLTDLEQMAVQNNPTLAQAEAAIRAAEGRKKQAGLYPNPTVGYRGEEFAFRAFNDKSEHFFFLEQTIVTGGKLKKSRAIFAEEQAQTEADAESQRTRVLNTVRLLYYEALGAQQLVELRSQLAKIASEAVGTSAELANIGQADKPDLLEAEIEAQRADLDMVGAENDRDQVWQLLATVVGAPSLKLSRLPGDLEKEVPVLDQEAMLATLLQSSPELRRARAGVERARAALERARAEPIPDLFVRAGIGYSTEVLERLNRQRLGRTGPEASIEVGIRLPLFNRNQGNIAAARAELIQAEREVQRQELGLRARFASVFRAYLNSLRAAQRYQRNILPRAQEAYDLYLTKFREMAAAYPQVLIAQRNMFQVRVDYVNSLVALWQSATQIQGLLLTGGLDAPGPPTRDGTVDPSQAAGIRQAVTGTGIREGREQ